MRTLTAPAGSMLARRASLAPTPEVEEARQKRAGDGGSRKKDGDNIGGQSRAGAGGRLGARRDSVSEAVAPVMGDGVALLRTLPAVAVGLGGQRLGLGVSRRHREP